MTFTYQTRRRWRRFFTALLWIILILAVAWIIWMVWLQRYVVYSRDGVRLDFSHSTTSLSGEPVQPPPPAETVAIYYNEGSDKIETGDNLAQINGACITTDALLYDLDTVKAQVQSLAPGSAVMIDLKSPYGNFYYSTQLEGLSTSDSLDISAMDDLLAWLKSSDLYTIARIPAFRDRSFALASHEDGTYCGLPEAAGNLWEDSQSCYWLDPARQEVKDHLVAIINELRVLGFDEVVFTDFRFPDSGGQIVYESERTQAEIIQDTAAELVSVCATGSFAVSFQADLNFPLPLGRSRLYVEKIAADQTDSAAAAAPVADPLVNLVFLADSGDTRYNDYSALRLLNIGQE